MRHKLALIIALASFAATILLAASVAGADSASEPNTAAATPVAPPPTAPAPTPTVASTPAPPAAPPVCADGVDNDGDGLVDLRDPSCAQDPNGTDEAATPPSASGNERPGTSSEVQQGTTIGGHTAVVPKSKSGVTLNQSIGVEGGRSGGLTAPASDGGAPQPSTDKAAPNSQFTDGGSPTPANPTTTIAPFGPAPIGVPNFVIDSFEIPPFLMPIYQACGTEYGIPWEVLAAINKIETAFGTNLNVSSAGAVGWMQFIPSSWETYGVDANGDGRKDPYNPVDAICAAARYLRAAGGGKDLYNAIFAYNHADWYVQEVLLYARAYGKLPENLVSSVSGLTEGAHFPVAANARYADDISARAALARAKPGARTSYGNAADVITSSPTRRGINIFSHRGAPIVAVNDGVIKKLGSSPKLGRYIVLQDAYGNRYTYAELGSIVRSHPVPSPHKLTAADFKLVTPPDDSKPTAPASDTTVNAAKGAANISSAPATATTPSPRAAAPTNTENLRPRLYALPERPDVRARAARTGQRDEAAPAPARGGFESFKNYFDDTFAGRRSSTRMAPLRVGSRVIGGTVLAHMAGPVDGVDPHVNFSIRPAGRGAPRIDPKPILDGWKLLEATAIYRASGKNPFRSHLGGAGVLLLSKEALQQRVLADPALSIYSCGRTDIATGKIDRRILAMLEYLVAKGFRMTITALECGHSYMTTSGNVSEHSSGNAVDIAVINGVPVTGHQGPGTLADSLIRTVLQLQGAMHPHQVISLEDLPGPTSFPLPDHYNHVHVGYRPMYGGGLADQQFSQLLKPNQWNRLMDRLGQIDNPKVPIKPSKYALPDKP